MANESELEALIVRLEADTASFKAELIASSKVVADSSKQMAAAIGDMSSKSDKHFSAFHQAAATALGVFTAEGLIEAVKFAGGIIVDVFKEMTVEGVKAAIAQQDAVNSLNQALSATGHYSQEASQNYIEFAHSLQQGTKFSEEATIESGALLASLGRLSGDGLKNATVATQNLAVGLGVDLHTAALMVSKAAEGNIMLFQRYGLTVGEGASKASTFASALRAINDHFGGAAAAQAQTFSGALAILNNTFRDVQKSIGSLVVDNQVFVSVIQSATTMIKDFNKYLTDNAEALKEGVAEGFILAIKGVNLFVLSLDVMMRTGDAVIQDLKAAFYGLGAAVSGVLSLVSDSQKAVFEEYKKKAIEAAQASNEAFTKESGLDKLSTQLTKLEGVAQGSLTALESGVTHVGASYKNAADETAKFTQAQLDSAAAGKKLADELSAQDPKKKAEQDLALYRAQADARLITETQYLNKSDALRKKEHAKELSDLKLAYKTKLIEKDKYDKALGELKTKQKKEDDKADAERVVKERELDKQRLQATSDIFGNIAELGRAAGKDGFEVAKAAAIAQSIVQGVLAVQNALAAAPPPFNFVLAATVGAVAAVNTAKIASSSPPAYASGGIVPGFSTIGDNVNARLNSGEMVLNNQQQTRLLAIADGQPLGGGSNQALQQISSKLDALSSAIMSQPVQVQIDGKTVFQAIRDQLRGGRSFVTA